jgi:hypothetical protein
MSIKHTFGPKGAFIVAAVEACDGIPIAALEKGIVKELIKACKEALEWYKEARLADPQAEALENIAGAMEWDFPIGPLEKTLALLERGK